MKKPFIAALLLAVPLMGAALQTSTAQTTAAQTTTIKIQHDEGLTPVPNNPKRVVVISEEMLDFAYALKMNVVGVGSPRITPAQLSGNRIKIDSAKAGFFKNGPINNLTYVGNWIEPSLETILTLKPDLIVRLHWSGLQGYDKLSAIAPTLSFGQDPSDTWQTILLELAKVGGKTELAKRFIRDYDTKLVNAKAQLTRAGALRNTPKFMVVCTFGSSGQAYLYSGNRVANVMRGLGFAMTYPEGLSRLEEEDKFGWQTLSPESLLKIPANTLVVHVPFVSTPAEADKVTGNLALLRKSKGLIVEYRYPEYSPWMGPNTDKAMISELSKIILAAQP